MTYRVFLVELVSKGAHMSVSQRMYTPGLQRERKSKLQRLHMTTNGGGAGIRHPMSGSYYDQASYLTWYNAIYSIGSQRL